MMVVYPAVSIIVPTTQEIDLGACALVILTQIIRLDLELVDPWSAGSARFGPRFLDVTQTDR